MLHQWCILFAQFRLCMTSFEAQWGVVTPNPPRGYATGCSLVVKQNSLGYVITAKHLVLHYIALYKHVCGLDWTQKTSFVLSLSKILASSSGGWDFPFSLTKRSIDTSYSFNASSFAFRTFFCWKPLGLFDLCTSRGISKWFTILIDYLFIH